MDNISESAACSSTTNYARSNTSVSPCVSGRDTVASTSDVDTSVTVHKVRTTTECEETVGEMYSFLEPETAISTILEEKSAVCVILHYRILVGKYLVLTITCDML